MGVGALLKGIGPFVLVSRWRNWFLVKAFALAAAALLMFPGAAYGFADYELTIYTPAERNSPAVEGVLRFIQLVEDRTNDRVQFDFFHGGAFGSDEEAVEDVVVGALDVVLVPLAAYARVHPQVQTWLLPYLFDDEAHLQEAISGPIARDFFKGLEWHGIQGLAFWHGGFRGLGTRGQAVAGVDDVADLVIGVPPLDVYTEAWTALGAEPVAVPWRDVPQQLQRGDIAAQDGTPDMFRRANLHETQDHYSVIDYSWMGFLLAANRYSWERLPTGIQQIIGDAAMEAGRWAAEQWKRRQSDALAAMEKAGVSVERSPDVTGFREQAHAFYATLQDKPWYDAKLVARIRGLAAKEDK